MAGATESNSGASSIHDRVVFKQAGLHERIQYDRYARKSLMDHFFDENVSVQQVRDGDAVERGDFVELPFDAKLRRAAGKIQVQMKRAGNAWGIPLTITKGITLFAGSHALEITYLLEGLPPGKSFHFGVEFNFAGMPSGADDRFFYDERAERMGHLGSTLSLEGRDYLGLIDQWLGANIQMTWNRPTHLWCFPVETVSQSEGGFELVHQSVSIIPHWHVVGDTQGRWCVSMDLITTCEHEPSSRAAQLSFAHASF
jgi:alpha-amylase